ncbi:GlmU family protein [Marinigracilibium pacificum]|uniref:Glucose-1-phosphate thymidylyltransferase n=1 Tax=Marinigracilibium pacificum TaxID=2729599 RepID=A0A848J784_9BACT|nr:GlmU family protein [Marinigracilibium pacificum]NMM50360.1 glucose-1-phosphate thymidylyltransferase [Marinigracilibium pacificum]
MNIVLFDNHSTRKSLLPFTFTRPVAEIRIGILTISEKWGKRLNGDVSFITESYLTKKFPLNHTDDNLYIDGALCPTNELIKKVNALKPESGFKIDDRVVVWRSSESITDFQTIESKAASCDQMDLDVDVIDFPWEIFQKNRSQIESDFELITSGRKSAEISDPHTIIYGKENVFIEEGVDVKAAVINAESGPIYIGKDVVIGEGAIIRGACAILNNSHVSMGAKFRGDSTIGPYCKVGGEVSNSVFIGYSNKSHDGFLGNAVIGEWCNMGADSNNSNLKNNYDQVKLWSYAKEGFIRTGQQFCGLMMGDHTKCGINTMFNTGTVTGVSANIFGAGFPRNFIPSYSWGGPQGLTTFHINKALQSAEIVMKRRGKELDEVEREILTHIFEETSKYRNWEV